MMMVKRRYGLRDIVPPRESFKNTYLDRNMMLVYIVLRQLEAEGPGSGPVPEVCWYSIHMNWIEPSCLSYRTLVNTANDVKRNM